MSLEFDPKTAGEAEVRCVDHLSRLGYTPGEARIILDLSKNAATKAFESIALVADLAPDQRARGLVIGMTATMIGGAVGTGLERRIAEMMSGLKQAAHEEPDKEPVGRRDFDGNFT